MVQDSAAPFMEAARSSDVVRGLKGRIAEKSTKISSMLIDYLRKVGNGIVVASKSVYSILTGGKLWSGH